ncbi:hypothetical protein KM043_004833 [Ampulex compressa]|nr:hypothetical protein KM043_004833 [Ampulex compressa]
MGSGARDFSSRFKVFETVTWNVFKTALSYVQSSRRSAAWPPFPSYSTVATSVSGPSPDLLDRDGSIPRRNSAAAPPSRDFRFDSTEALRGLTRASGLDLAHRRPTLPSQYEILTYVYGQSCRSNGQNGSSAKSTWRKLKRGIDPLERGRSSIPDSRPRR